MKGFFVSTVGLNTKVVEDYIRNQEKEDMVQDNLSTKEHIDPFKGEFLACILMHDQIMHGTLFNSFGHHDFVQQVARYDSLK